MGVVYVALVLFLPYGIVGTWQMRGARWRQGWKHLLHLGDQSEEKAPAKV